MEEMNYVFGVATHRHMNYQTKEVAPWCYKHYILRRKGALDPLYRWDRQREDIDEWTNKSEWIDKHQGTEWNNLGQGGFGSCRTARGEIKVAGSGSVALDHIHDPN
ncbi:hypothetical protein XANCAGTX0491_002468 [Xanthoria calcicola]